MAKKEDGVIDLTSDDAGPVRTSNVLVAKPHHDLVYGVLRARVKNVIWDSYLSSNEPKRTEPVDLVLNSNGIQVKNMLGQQVGPQLNSASVLTPS